MENEIVSLSRQINEKDRVYKGQQQILEEESIKCENQKQEIEEKDQMINEKEKRIYSLKKKTQELEKFKYVLDYKI